MQRLFRKSYDLEENKKIYDEYFDPDYAFSLEKNVVHFLDTYYFRSRLIGFETIPMRNHPPYPLIFISNHSGMSFPWDAILFASKYIRRNEYDMTNAVRALAAPMLSQSTYMNPYLIENLWRRAGGVDATLENFDTMMHYEKSNLLIYPEGVPGIAKGFDKRYRLQRFSSSFIRMALKYKTDIIPVSTVNAEYLNPYSYKSEELNKLAQKLGIPMMPIGILPLFIPFQPWIFYFGLPARLTYVRGKTIRIYEMTDKDVESLRNSEINQIKEEVRRHFQRELTEAVDQYGDDPYHLEELGDIWNDNRDKLLYISPSGWPLLMYEHERLYRNAGKGKSFTMRYTNDAFWEALWKNPAIISFVLPLIGLPMLLKWKNVI